MAQYRAVIKGQRGEASRLGGKSSGIYAVVNGWNLGVEVSGYFNQETGKDTLYGFRHLATLHKAGFEVGRAKICYYNRTWERFEFESVLIRCIENNFTGREREEFLQVIKDIN